MTQQDDSDTTNYNTQTNETPLSLNNYNNINPSPSNIQPSANTAEEDIAPMEINIDKVTKRPLSLSSNNTSISEYNHNDSKVPLVPYKSTKKANTNKKLKIDPKPTKFIVNTINNLDEHLLPAKAKLEESQNILSYDQFKSLIENTLGKQDPTEIVKEYSKNIPEITNMIKAVHSLITDRSTKIRLHKLKKKLEHITDESESEKDLSDSSD